jgi:hypothetical protein
MTECVVRGFNMVPRGCQKSICYAYGKMNTAMHEKVHGAWKWFCLHIASYI